MEGGKHTLVHLAKHFIIWRSTFMTLIFKFNELWRWDRITSPSAVIIVTTAVINILRIVNTMILTRILTPSDFGLISIVMSIFFAINMITDAGFYAHVVRHERGLEPHFLNAIWSIHFTRGLINCLIAIMLSIPLSWGFGKPKLALLLVAASLTLAIDGTASLTLITAFRQKLVRRLSVVDLSVFLVQFVFGIIAALYMRNVWAMVVAMIVASISRSAASYLLFPMAKRRFVYDRHIAGELWHFSRMIALSSSLTLLISQIDRLVLAKMFSLEQFGVYAVASNLALAPIALAGIYNSRIVYPALSAIWRTDRARLSQNYYQLRGIVFYGYLVGAGLLCGAAPLIVKIIYDTRYQGAGFYLRLMAIVTAMSMLNKQMNELLVVAGQVRVTLETNIVRMIWLATAIAVGLASAGPLGLIIALALVEIPAYIFGSWKSYRLGFYNVRNELFALFVIGVSIVVGLILSLIFANLLLYGP